LRGGRHEALRGGKQQLEPAQRLLCQRGQLQGARSRHHAAGHAHEQLIAQRLAQAGQGVAEGRLAEVQPGRGAGDAALGHQRVKNHQQTLRLIKYIQILDCYHRSNQFPK